MKLTKKRKIEGWFRLEDGRIGRRHTKASAIIRNVIDPVFYWGQSDKYAFKVEDALKQAGLLKEKEREPRA
jgi:hypothetical protein